jgi:hypothetical protein
MPAVVAEPKPRSPEAAAAERTPRVAVQERIDAFEVEAKKRLDHLLHSGNERLTQIDHFLERVSKEDWTLTGMRRRFGALRSRAENAGTTALKRVDEMPAEAVSALATAGRARIQDLSRGLSALARRLDAPPPGPPAAG